MHTLSTKSTEITRKTSGTENEEKKALVHFEHSAQVDRGAAELFTLVFRPIAARANPVTIVSMAGR